MLLGLKARAKRYLGSSLPGHVRHFKIIMQTDTNNGTILSTAIYAVPSLSFSLFLSLWNEGNDWTFFNVSFSSSTSFVPFALITAAYIMNLTMKTKSLNFSLFFSCAWRSLFAQDEKNVIPQYRNRQKEVGKKQCERLENVDSICFVYRQHLGEQTLCLLRENVAYWWSKRIESNETVQMHNDNNCKQQ